MPFDRLDGNAIRAYTQAIMDVTEVVGYVNDDLRLHRMRPFSPLLLRLLRCVLENRANLREQRPGFFRWNVVKKDFEFFCTEKETQT